MQYRLRYKSHFDSAHFLRNYSGKCAKLHGHRWEVEIELSGDRFDSCGILIDYGRLKKILEDALPDHTCLNEIDYFKRINPTAENLSYWLFSKIVCMLPAYIRLERVEVWESPGASAFTLAQDFVSLDETVQLPRALTSESLFTHPIPFNDREA